MKKIEYSNIKGIKYVGEDFKTHTELKSKPSIDKPKKIKEKKNDSSGSAEGN